MAAKKPPGPPSPAPTASILTRLGYGLLPGHCILCKSESVRTLDLCAVCEHDLPAIALHCHRCSLPLYDNEDDRERRPDTGSNTHPEKRPKPLTCANCLQKTPYFAQTYIPFLYHAPIDRLLIQFKFKGNLVAGKVLGKLLAQHLEQCFKENYLKQDLENNKPIPDTIIPVPLHWRRRFTRGFNQAHEIAVILSKQLGIPVDDRLIKRSIHTPAQTSLDRKQRTRNVNKAFTLVDRGINTNQQIVGKSLAIVDDVMTTGSTANAIARLLMDNGAAQVVVWAIARVVTDNLP